MTNRLPGSVPPDSELLSTTAAAWARDRLHQTALELRELTDRAHFTCPGVAPMTGATFGLEGLFKFHFDSDAVVLWAQFGDEPADAIYFRADSAAFTRRSEPTTSIEPLGFLRGRILEAIGRAGGARFTSMPPAGGGGGGAVVVPGAPKVPKVE